MTLEDLIAEMRFAYDGFNPPASSTALSRATALLELLPDEVARLYRDHDGSPGLPRRGDRRLPARLIPLTEATELQPVLAEAIAETASVGNITWLWTDDNSNYLGIYTSGCLTGWLAKLNHEEPILTPAYRSVTEFLTRMMGSAPGVAAKDGTAHDLVMIPRQIPLIAEDARRVDTDRSLVQSFLEMHQSEPDGDRRRLYAMCAICLTPPNDTGSLVSLLHEDDMWVPEAAVVLMELRRYGNAVEELERLARDGYPNGDSAAMRMLVRQGTAAANEAIGRLRGQLKGQKLQSLEMWLRNQQRLLPPRWE